MELTIVVPVLNEEGSVEKVARACLAARSRIIAETPVTRVHVVVVSDGSTDRTAEIARAIDEVTTVVFPENQGYGAAIQRGWAEKPADLLAFLDGDGTCDPAFFVTLVRAMDERHADVALGSRMGKESRMPLLRRVGNWLFALLLGFLSRQAISDSASGMRVVRRTALKRLLPLPTGLHFTPAMSARALIGGIPIIEVPMAYAERVGRSKLSVLRDGLRFLAVILSAAAYVRPSRLTFPLIGALLVASLALGFEPGFYYLTSGHLEEGMIYRFLFVAFLADVGVFTFCATLVAEHAIALGLLRYGAFAQAAPWWWDRRGLRLYTWFAGAGLAAGTLLVLPGARSLWSTGAIPADVMHWSRVIVAAFSGLTFLQIVSTRLLVALLDGVHTRQGFLLDDAS
jgi:glycosyltransferase involved in cell wall biosynthesis